MLPAVCSLALDGRLDRRADRPHLWTAAHFVAHGFEVVIYEAEGEIGGVWSRVNSTSSLQLNSISARLPTLQSSS